MKMDKVAGSGFDDFFTPKYAITPLLKYLKNNSTIWCPFDLPDSYFVKMMKDCGHFVKHSHISEGKDFFETKEECDYIISNPPYSLKAGILENLFQRKIPFAMLVGVVGLFESQRRFEFFKENNFEIMYFNKRVSYFKNYEEVKPEVNPPFSSVYVCQNILPKQIVFERVDNKDVKYESS